jgi:hypothetical protein
VLHHFAGLAPAEYLAMHSGEHVIRHPDGSADFVGIPESKHRDLDRRVLHRATCETLGDHDDHYQMICGTRAELEDIMKDYDKLCPACL